jgi:hypothetical protein
MKSACVRLLAGSVVVLLAVAYIAAGVAHGEQVKPATPQGKSPGGVQSAMPNQDPNSHKMVIINGPHRAEYTFTKARQVGFEGQAGVPGGRAGWSVERTKVEQIDVPGRLPPIQVEVTVANREKPIKGALISQDPGWLVVDTGDGVVSVRVSDVVMVARLKAKREELPPPK